LDAAAGEAGIGFEAANIIALPAVEGDGDFGELAHGFFGIDAPGGELFFGEGIGVGHRGLLGR